MTTASLLLLTIATADAQPATSRGVVLDFTATWCGPCQQMNPIVSRLKRQGYPIRKVDVDRERALAQKFNVRSMPTFILVVDGKEKTRITGMTSESQLRRLLAQIPNDPQPSVTNNPDPRQVAQGRSRSPASSRQNNQVADNGESPARTRTQPRFTFPFGGNKKKAQPTEPAREEAPVIRAKLDQEEKPERASVEEDPLASSVRVRITNQGGMNYGSGTIIESRPGRTLILTCGHIFRDLKSDAKIEVDVFTGSEEETFAGKTIGFDLEGDVGLLSIATDDPLAISPLAAMAKEVKVRQSVYSIGCGGGEPPSREDLHVTAMNRYLGPDNIECTGEPLQGRSGGGLFNSHGDVVGVCVAADPRDKRGLYAGLPVIHSLLKKHDFSHLIPKSSSDEAPVIVKTAVDNLPAVKPNVAPPIAAAVAKGGEKTLPAALENPGEAEVVCIVRPLGQPQSASQVVIINRASSRFVSYLTEELDQQPMPTMLAEARRVPQNDPEPPPFANEEPEPPPFAEPSRDTSSAAPTVERYRRQR